MNREYLLDCALCSGGDGAGTAASSELDDNEDLNDDTSYIVLDEVDNSLADDPDVSVDGPSVMETPEQQRAGDSPENDVTNSRL